jgi:hypothetical protein
VTVAYFEQVQKTYKFYWPLVEVQQRLDEKMTRAFQGVHEMYQREKVTMRQAAYLVAISRVTEANKRCGGGCKHRLIGPHFRSRSLLEPDNGGNAKGGQPLAPGLPALGGGQGQNCARLPPGWQTFRRTA